MHPGLADITNDRDKLLFFRRRRFPGARRPRSRNAEGLLAFGASTSLPRVGRFPAKLCGTMRAAKSQYFFFVLNQFAILLLDSGRNV